MYALINSRIKVLSRLKLNVTNSPQDGRFSITASDTSIEVRTSVLPGPNGESPVLRILNPKTIALSLEDLGLLPHDMELITKNWRVPTGLFGHRTDRLGKNNDALRILKKNQLS